MWPLHLVLLPMYFLSGSAQLFYNPFHIVQPWWMAFPKLPRYGLSFQTVPWIVPNSERQLNLSTTNEQVQFRSDSEHLIFPAGYTSSAPQDRQLGTLIRRLSDLRDIWSLCSSGGRKGNCLPPSVCSYYGGLSAGFGTACILSTCCIKIVDKCDSVITMNSTYWRSPSTLGSSCKLTIRIDARLVEQRRLPICQVRLYFDKFSIQQPDSTSKCSGDTFTVSGAQNRVPTICGDNDGQHMYLTVPPTLNERSTIDLEFKFSSSSLSRSWIMSIEMLPCSSRFLAPRDCLQYFIQSSGIGFVQSFNWKDVSNPGVAGTAVRQLANQDYTVCIRTETVTINDDRASQICYTPCTSNVGASTTFSISRDLSAGARSDVADCLNDYIGIPGASDGSNAADRFCGTYLNPYSTGTTGQASVQKSTTVCTSQMPFRVIVKTDDKESASARTLPNGVTVAAETDVGNIGFCLQFQQKL